ncbi:MAG: hypothetical protein ACE5SW_08970 [Nitrososphaeraceae archaeon]
MSENTSNYIDNWTTGVDSFTVDASNAVLVIDGQEQQDVVVV